MIAINHVVTETKKEVIAILNKGSLLSFSDDEIVIVLCAFFNAARKENGQEYKGHTIYSIACALQRFLEKTGRSINFH